MHNALLLLALTFSFCFETAQDCSMSVDFGSVFEPFSFGFGVQMLGFGFKPAGIIFDRAGKTA